MFDWLFNGVGWLIAWIYSWSNSYSVAIGAMAIVVMIVITPLTLKSTRGMLEMQRLQPELRRLQIEFKGDRQGMNEEMMKLYQEHKVNPLASCLPLLAQMPVFIIMFRLIRGLTFRPEPGAGFTPMHLDKTSELYQSLVGKTEMRSFGLDLAVHPIEVMRTDLQGACSMADSSRLSHSCTSSNSEWSLLERSARPCRQVNKRFSSTCRLHSPSSRWRCRRA